MVPCATTAPGTLILQSGQSQVTHLLIIYEGQVRLFLPGQDGSENLQRIAGPGRDPGRPGHLPGEPVQPERRGHRGHRLPACIPREEFLGLTAKSARFAQYYLKFLSEHYVGKALTELKRQPRTAVSTEGSLYLFSAQVGDVVRRRGPR